MVLTGTLGAPRASAQNVSQPAILQWFEGTYKTIEYRTPDYFMAGYGGLWTPPPGRADAGNLSVGYDQYDRFDLGSAGNSTLYGTETGLKSTISEIHKVNGRVYLDLIWNHDGFSDWNNTDGQGHTFLNAGGYPGFYMSTGNGNWGDFHDPSAGGDEQTQLAGLIDIDQSTNNVYVRNPIPGNANNLPAGTQSAYGRLANVPTEANRRFYPDQSMVTYVNDPALGQTNVPIYDFNTANPSSGTPIAENATGYLMRNARWLIQNIGADGFRLDATKNYPDWVLKYLDHATYNAITKPMLDGTRQQVWAFGENFDSNWGVLQSRVRQDIYSQPANTVGGNRDTLDFSLYYAMQHNLSDDGLQNNWNSVVNSSFDGNDDGYANSGTQGVAFVQSHDDSGPPPHLANVAYAYTLLRPGNAIVYYNAHEFGNGRAFPNPGRDDALGGPAAGNKYITTLVDIRNRYGTGNYIPRTVTSGTTTNKEDLVYERDRSVIVALSNRLDNGYDAVTVQTGFHAGTPLIELTGNASDSTVDPNDDIPSVVVVNGDGTINFRIPRNKNVNGVEHGRGYVMYGPSGPQGLLSVSNVSTTIAPDANAGANGTSRITPIKVINQNSFTVTLNTNAVNLLGSIRDHDADGDNAILKIDGGLDLNNNGHVDHVTARFHDNNYPNTPQYADKTIPNTLDYGFEEFTTTHTPGYTSANNNGVYAQNIDATQLSEGYHYIESRAFRHRDANIEGANVPAIWSSFKDVIYIDRLPPNSAPNGIEQKPGGSPNDKRFNVQSVDKTANNVFVLLDQPATKTNAQILASLSGSTLR